MGIFVGVHGEVAAECESPLISSGCPGEIEIAGNANIVVAAGQPIWNQNITEKVFPIGCFNESYPLFGSGDSIRGCAPIVDILRPVGRVENLGSDIPTNNGIGFVGQIGSNPPINFILNGL